MFSLDFGCRVRLINPDEEEDREDIELLKLITSLLGGELEDQSLTDLVEEVSDNFVIDASEE